MAKSFAKVAIRGYGKLIKDIESTPKNAQKVISRTLSDIRTKAPGWVATEVTKVYGVPKQQITGQKIGNVRVEGNSLKDMRIIYKGRVLTPTHFGMTPKQPGKNAYTLKASIFKGQKATLGKVKKLTKKQRATLGKNFRKAGTQNSDHSPIMLMYTGNQKLAGTNYIPFQRKSHNRNDVKAIKTLSLPQMVSSMRTEPQIMAAINEGLEKRLAHHMKLLEK